MSGYKEWVQRNRGNPAFLAIAFVGFTTSFYVLYRWKVNPFLQRRRMNENKEYAEFIYGTEIRKEIGQ